MSENNNAKFAIRINHYYYITKDKNKATNLVKIDNASNDNIKIVKELKDPNNTHKYTTKLCVEAIRNYCSKNNIILKYNNYPAQFTKFHFNNFCKHFGLKNNDIYCYTHKTYSQPQYSYSQQAIDFITNELKKDPENILNNIKK